MAFTKAWSRACLSCLSFCLLLALSLYLQRDFSKQPEGHIHSRSLSYFHDAELPASSNASLLHRREDYTCGAGNPCSNGACCGESGYCGYGPTYCGNGCTSNCDATAECGQYAATPGTTCPLNTCCSEYGFCGTTEDFCTGNCQSNCDLDPSPPSGSALNQALSKVIGYYESWSYTSDCNKKSPTDLPLSELTHLNYAFAYIDPATYELTTMDSTTPENLFQLTVDTKKYNSALKVFISVGGWTFSDNGTVTQPLFSEISSTEANRQKFADNVVKFMNKYGFDGIDIDWEYPGAPDRGGKDEDTENFVLLMKTLRTTFNAAPRTLGLTFTTPSSYWYLRWFDLPGLLKYADWTNLMSYDLHGTWDRNNPIGAIVQGHTNLTEIQLAVQLFWRVGVKPSQIALGYGFYGRSFQLSDSSCTAPGCAFKGGASPGPCSATSGILMYYEIQQILKQIPGIEPVHDEDAAIKYLVFDNDQWVSYDDEKTFGSKLAWANAVGIGGSLIWAVDTDDDQFSAISGFLGEEVSHVDTDSVDVSLKSLAITTSSVVSSLVGENGQDCKVMKAYSCKHKNDLRCESGFKLIGWDRDGCSNSDYGKPICCPQATAPSNCQWRGGGGDCNGQCHVGESTLFHSSWGGGYETEGDTGRCTRGVKVFCCEAGDWKDVIDGCYWTGCGKKCDSDSETELSYTNDGCTIFNPKKRYCCPKDTPLYDCTWRGSWGDCPDAKCNSDEVAIRNDESGDASWTCHWWRQRTDCCKVAKAPVVTNIYCDITSCDLDPSICDPDNVDDDGIYQRDLDRYESSLDGHDLSIEKRGKGRRYAWYTLAGHLISHNSRSYPTGSDYMRNIRNQMTGLATRWWQMRSRSCDDPAVAAQNLESTDTPPDDADIEHPIPLVAIGRFASVANHGSQWSQRPVGARYRAPDGRPTRTAAISDNFWRNVWQDANALPSDLPLVSSRSPRVLSPVQRLYERLGSTTNANHFTILRQNVNAVKGRLEGYKRPMTEKKFKAFVDGALNGGAVVEEVAYTEEECVEAFFAPLRETRGTFQYLNAEDVIERLDTVASGIHTDLLLIEQNTEGSDGLAAHWNEFYPYYFEQVSEFARNFVADQIAVTRAAFRDSSSPYRDYVLSELKKIEDAIPEMKYPWED